jgi:chromosome segregation ATPase
MTNAFAVAALLDATTLLSGNNAGAVFGVIGTVLGGIGVELLRRLAARSEKKMDDAAKIRQELWAELAVVRDEVSDLRTELDEWKEKYFKLYAENTQLLRENLTLTTRNKELEVENGALKLRIVALGERRCDEPQLHKED